MYYFRSSQYISYLVGFVIIFFTVSTSIAQRRIQDTEWEKLIGYLSKENHEKSKEMSFKLLQRFTAEDDTTYEAANLRYMYLFSISGLISRHELEKEEGAKLVETLVGKKFITPSKEFRKNCIFNCFFWKKYEDNQEEDSVPTLQIEGDSLVVKPKITTTSPQKDGEIVLKNNDLILKIEDKLYIAEFFGCVANDQATHIQSFDSYKFANPLDKETFLSMHNAFNKTTLRLETILLKVETGGVTMPHLKLEWGIMDIIPNE
jgi:hypothetical protein